MIEEYDRQADAFQSVWVRGYRRRGKLDQDKRRVKTLICFHLNISQQILGLKFESCLEIENVDWRWRSCSSGELSFNFSKNPGLYHSLFYLLFCIVLLDLSNWFFFSISWIVSKALTITRRLQITFSESLDSWRTSFYPLYDYRCFNWLCSISIDGRACQFIDNFHLKYIFIVSKVSILLESILPQFLW